MTEIKKEMDSSIKDILKNQMNTGHAEKLMKSSADNEQLFEQIVQVEVDKLKKDAK